MFIFTDNIGNFKLTTYNKIIKTVTFHLNIYSSFCKNVYLE